jgi:4-carboxymuconolactone decarboxylase
MSEKRSALPGALGTFAPKLVELTDGVLFGDVWAREPLGRRERSLITVAALVALNRPEQLRFHLDLAVRHGLTQEELVEALTHLAFYAGWPLAINAMLTARELFTPAQDEP